MPIRPVRFSRDDAVKAGEWKFNCGPGALCAILHLTPDEIRPIMGDFERKGYTNPTLMFDVLRNAKAKFRQIYRKDDPAEAMTTVTRMQHGLVRVQWGGPWTKPGVPFGARYRQTHWIGVRKNAAPAPEIFDINAICAGGWLSYREWREQLVPWLCKEVVPKWDGTLWSTHAIEVE